MDFIKKVISKNHILLVDDDDRLRDLLGSFLKENNFLITTAENAIKARDMLKSFIFDLLILDVMMPGEDGVSLAKSIREQDKNIPILMLTALSEMNDKIKGLSVGIDDYVTKPFEPKELLLRIKNILRRAKGSNDPTKIYFGNFIYDKDRKQLFKDNTQIKLTETEAGMLDLFISNPRKIITRDDIAKKLNISDNLRTIDVQITRLRKKVEKNAKTPKYILTVRNKGYQFIPD